MAKLVIREERCKSCGICLDACPNACLEVSNRLNAQGYRPVAVKDAEACTGCAICARLCPDVVIEVWK